MSRVSFAIIFGILFPFAYLFVFSSFLFLITTILFTNGIPSLIEKILFFPLGWADLIYDWLFESRDFFEFTNPRWILFFFGGNFLLYFMLGNFIWGWRKNKRKNLSIIEIK